MVPDNFLGPLVLGKTEVKFNRDPVVQDHYNLA